ncbi:hypothetical protein E5S70_07620 [Ensifer adhaerens]|nr:hypothetical protein [Ensifer canadensis]
MPLTVLPDISPRQRGESRWERRFRRTSALMGAVPARLATFAPLAGRRCWQADEGRYQSSS